jgi:hypothetical protein
MEYFRTEGDANESFGGTESSSWANDGITLMTHLARTPTVHQKAGPDEDIICEALHLTLSAVHLDIACHTGVISAEAAMESLHQEIAETVSRSTSSIRTRVPGHVTGVLCRGLR